MSPSDAATVSIALLAALGLIGAIVAWFYRRGGTETAMEIALDRNTTATEKLTDKIEGVVTRLHDHDIRLTKLEANTNGSAPTHRNAGTPPRH
jgi:hypothetical protein